MSLYSSLSISLKPDECLCVGCFQVHTKGSCYTGKLNKGVHFAEKVTEELSWNPLTGKTEVELVSKKFPIGKWVRGFICSKCAANYHTVTHVRKNGETWYEPVVILDPSSTLSQTINGGDSYLPPQSLINSPDDDFGFSKLPPKEEIDVKSYQALLGHRRRLTLNDVVEQPVRVLRQHKSDSQLNAEAKRRS